MFEVISVVRYKCQEVALLLTSALEKKICYSNLYEVAY